MGPSVALKCQVANQYKLKTDCARVISGFAETIGVSGAVGRQRVREVRGISGGKALARFFLILATL